MWTQVKFVYFSKLNASSYIPLSRLCICRYPVTHPFASLFHSSSTKPKKKKPMTLKGVQNCLQVTLEKKRFLDLSRKQLSVVPKCLLKLCDIDELNLSLNEIKVIPNFIIEFKSISVLDLHSNYVSIAQQLLFYVRHIILSLFESKRGKQLIDRGIFNSTWGPQNPISIGPKLSLLPSKMVGYRFVKVGCHYLTNPFSTLFT